MSRLDPPAFVRTPPVDGSSRTWAVGALCRAIGDALQARFNPVAVSGEISGFSRAASGHCYFSLKDADGQLRCAMFRRAAGLLDFQPRDGERVEVRGRLAVYEPRGDLQLVVESMSRAGQGALFEQFLRLKASLEAEGLFDPDRKRPVPFAARTIGVVTSPGAAALHDVVTALRRRAPHVPVVIAPAQVQGAAAPAELVRALESLYARVRSQAPDAPDVILLVRGGGSIEDLWAFNDERLARTIVQSPVPLICGVGHETDFTIADFCADVRAPTPTAAAEMAAQPLQAWLNAVDLMQTRLADVVRRRLDVHGQRLDRAAQRMGRPSTLLVRQQVGLQHQAARLRDGVRQAVAQSKVLQDELARRLPQAGAIALERQRMRLAQSERALALLDPSLVLQRGYAWLTDAEGQAISQAASLQAGQPIVATLADGEVDLRVQARR